MKEQLCSKTSAKGEHRLSSLEGGFVILGFIEFLLYSCKFLFGAFVSFYFRLSVILCLLVFVWLRSAALSFLHKVDRTHVGRCRELLSDCCGSCILHLVQGHVVETVRQCGDEVVVLLEDRDMESFRVYGVCMECVLGQKRVVQLSNVHAGCAVPCARLGSQVVEHKKRQFSAPIIIKCAHR